eukprot:TRINITY_DN19373_c0_g1_i1.p1 TRINITY_DN19373_c0_g1~~TRINITY_DN19373_c0_g1_i1.p1  ORF type:complete len:554 (-),score=95.29 TRINITY_DN19373_c0_g1_i1:20-1618(-)
MDPASVTVLRPDGGVVATLLLNPTKSVADLKAQIEGAQNVPSGAQVLLLNGRNELRDDAASLESYGVVGGAEVFVVLEPSGGGGEERRASPLSGNLTSADLRHVLRSDAALAQAVDAWRDSLLYSGLELAAISDSVSEGLLGDDGFAVGRSSAAGAILALDKGPQSNRVAVRRPLWLAALRTALSDVLRAVEAYEEQQALARAQALLEEQQALARAQAHEEQQALARAQAQEEQQALARAQALLAEEQQGLARAQALLAKRKEQQEPEPEDAVVEERTEDCDEDEEAVRLSRGAGHELRDHLSRPRRLSNKSGRSGSEDCDEDEEAVRLSRGAGHELRDHLSRPRRLSNKSGRSGSEEDCGEDEEALRLRRGAGQELHGHLSRPRPVSSESGRIVSEDCGEDEEALRLRRGAGQELHGHLSRPRPGSSESGRTVSEDSDEDEDAVRLRGAGSELRGHLLCRRLSGDSGRSGASEDCDEDELRPWRGAGEELRAFLARRLVAESGRSVPKVPSTTSPRESSNTTPCVPSEVQS